jgi:hypothetical protein
MTPESRNIKTVIAKQRLVQTRFRDDQLEESVDKQRLSKHISFRYKGELKQVFMVTANNKGMNCCTWCSVSGPLEASSGRDTESRERESSRGLRIEDG